jgi:hypothetical protein
MQKKTIYRLASLFILVAMVFGSTLMAHATMQPAPLDALAVTINPVADAYVIASSASSNYGTSVSLRVDSSPVTRSYLRFTCERVGWRSRPICHAAHLCQQRQYHRLFGAGPFE